MGGIPGAPLLHLEDESMDEITMYPYKEMNLKGATVVNGFPTAGLVSTITANYLIGVLNLDQIAVLDSPEFPPVSMIYDAKPKFPARIYADEKSKVVVFLSEFTPISTLVRPLANVIFDFMGKNRCSRIIAPEVVPEQVGTLEVFGVGSTDNARAMMGELGIKSITHGIITGISGVLLNEGRRRNFDVINLVAQASPEMPDARAAGMLIEIISRIANISIDIAPLYREAERIEARIRSLREESKKATKPSSFQDMYI